MDCAKSCCCSDWGRRRFALCAIVALVVVGGCPNLAVASHGRPTEDAQAQYAVGIDLGSSCIRVGVHNGSVVKLVSLKRNGSADPGLDHSSISIVSGHSDHADAVDISSASSTRQLQTSLRSHTTNSTCSSGMPSLIAFNDTAEQLVGWKAWEAIQRGAIPPHNIITGSVKHLLGRSCNDTIVAKLQKHVAYQIVDHDGQAAIQVDINGTQQLHTPQSIVTSMLAEVHQQLPTHLNGPVKSTVIGLPATASQWIAMDWSLADKAQQMWKDAATAAGFNTTTLRVSQEAVLASLALNAHKLSPQRDDTVLLVFNLGATSLDAVLLEVDSYQIYQDLHTESSFDMAYKALKMLTQSVWADGASSDGVHDNLWDFLSKVSLNLPTALNVPSANVSQYIDYVLLVGGGARLPIVQQTIGDYFGSDKVINQTGLPAEGLPIEPEDAVAVGAALLAQTFAKADGGRLCCPGRYEPDDPNCDGFMTCCFDVTELSVGVETVGGLTHQITARNLITPTKKQAMFETVQDGQTSVVIKVYAGESVLSKYNLKLGELSFNNLAPAPAGAEQFIVEVDMGLQNITITATMLSQNISNFFTVHLDYPLDNWMPQLNAHFIQESEASIVKGKNESASLDAPWIQHMMHRYADQSRGYWEFDQLFCNRGDGSAVGRLIQGQTDGGKTSTARSESNDNKVQGPSQVSDVQGAAGAAMAAATHAQKWLQAQEIEHLMAEDEAPVLHVDGNSRVFGSRVEKFQQLPDLEHQVALACRQLCSYVHLPLDIQQNMHLVATPEAESCQPQQLDVSEGDAGPVADDGKPLGPWARAMQQPSTAVRPTALQLVDGLEGLKTLVRVCGAVAGKFRSEAQQGSANTDEHVLVT